MHGCNALKTQHGSHLVKMKRRMNQQVASKGIQLVTISRPTAYGNMHLIHLLRMKKNLRN